MLSEITPDWEAFLRCLAREGTPRRVHYIELLIDEEVRAAVAERFGLMEDVGPADPFYGPKREIRVLRRLGYDYVRYGVDDVGIRVERLAAQDTAGLERAGGRQYVNEHRGPITTAVAATDSCQLFLDSLSIVSFDALVPLFRRSAFHLPSN